MSIVDFDIMDVTVMERIRILQGENISCSVDIYQQQKNQHHMRERIELQFNRLLKTKNRKPNMFGLAIYVYGHIDESIIQSNICRQYEAIADINFIMDDVNQSETIGEKFKCICGQSVSPENIYKITNTITGKWLHVGSECVKKHAIISTEQLKILSKRRKDEKKRRKKELEQEMERIRLEHEQNQLRQQQEQLRQQREQENEERIKKIKEQEEQIQLEYNRQFLMCPECGNRNIPIDKKRYWTMCKNCYYNSKILQSQTDNRVCVDCNKTIESNKPLYITRCIACYIISKK